MGVPKLTAEQMAAAMQRLRSLPIDDAAKQRIALMLAEAASGEARHDTARLDPGRALDIQTTATLLVAQFDEILVRAAAGLAEMPDDEWDALVEEANRG